MKKQLLIISSLFISWQVQGQTVLFTENFNGATSAFTLNTSDQSSTTSGVNSWIINNSYNGGSFIEPCLSSTINIATTPAQTAGITGAPNSKYLHIVNNAANGAGVSNANFVASDGGWFCYNNENNFAKMTNDISTVGYNNVSFSFYYLCTGSAASYGELYYSTNGGSTWFLHQGNLYNQNSWTQANYTNATWDNQATLRFGFRFVNNFTMSASDPPFSVDEINITGSPIITNTITTDNVSANSFCPGDSVSVAYTASGTFTGGNVFTAQLSNELGSFASPTNIGTITSTVSGIIDAVIPIAANAGTGYRIRVISSTPAVTGSDNGANLSVGIFPVANFNSNINALFVQFIDNSSGAVSWFWDFGDGGTSMLQNPTHTYAYADTFTVCLTVYSASGCPQTICREVITSLLSLDNETSLPYLIFPNPATDYIMIQFSENLQTSVRAEILGMDGKIIKTQMLQSNHPISLHEFASGTYIIRISVNDQIYHSRIVRP